MTDKGNITLAFSITLSGKFLPMQVIFTGKTKAGQPRGFIFSKGFFHHAARIQKNLKSCLLSHLLFRVCNEAAGSARNKMLNLIDHYKDLVGHSVSCNT